MKANVTLVSLIAFLTIASPATMAKDAFSHYQKFLDAGVPETPLREALEYYEDHQSKIKNKKYISIADYSQRSNKKRFYLLNMNDGSVVKEKVSHGSGKVSGRSWGDPDHDGYIDRCIHPSSSPAKHDYQNMTRVGFMLTSWTYRSGQKFPVMLKNGHNAMKLVGLESKNKDAFKNGVVMHEASYNRAGNKTYMGRSWGCPAFVPGKGAKIISKIKDGSLFYSYAPKCD